MKGSKVIMVTIAVVILLTLFLIPSVSAQHIKDTQGISEIEKYKNDLSKYNNLSVDEIISMLPKGQEIKQEDVRKAIEARKQAEKDMDASIKQAEKNMDDSIYNQSKVGAQALATVILGKDTTLNGCDYWSANWGSSQGAIGKYGSCAWTFYQSEEAAIAQLPSFGSMWAWAQIGKKFTVSGTGSKAANIIVPVSWLGSLTTVGTGSSAFEINMVIKDNATGGTQRSTIEKDSLGIPYDHKWYDNFESAQQSIVLKGGHTYTVYVELKTSTGVWYQGYAESDFGYQDGDDTKGEDVFWYNLKIDF